MKENEQKLGRKVMDDGRSIEINEKKEISSGDVMKSIDEFNEAKIRISSQENKAYKNNLPMNGIQENVVKNNLDNKPKKVNFDENHNLKDGKKKEEKPRKTSLIKSYFSNAKSKGDIPTRKPIKLAEGDVIPRNKTRSGEILIEKKNEGMKSFMRQTSSSAAKSNSKNRFKLC